MRSKTCWFQLIFQYKNTKLLLLFSIITPWYKLLWQHTKTKAERKSVGIFEIFAFCRKSQRRASGPGEPCWGYVSIWEFVVFKPLSYCFEETIGYDVNTLFARPPVTRIIKPNDITKNVKKSLLSSTEHFMDWKLQTDENTPKSWHIIPCLIFT